ncbi:MAG: HAD-IA family hydrolase [Candidatus Chromulinivorax sp.]|nr:HAD-IA family hydrolase [Candidatus Chromulinivorax sp.]
MNKQYLIVMLALLPTQHIKPSDYNMNKLYTIGGVTALIGALAYATHSHINQPITIPNTADSAIKSIIFDIDGVLSTTNKLRAFYEVGLPATLWEIADQMKLPSEQLLFDILADVPAVSTDHSYTKGLQMPQIMIDWQTGAQSLSAIRKSIIDYLATSNKPESAKNWALQTAMMMTDPAKFVATRQTITANVELLHQLKEKGYKLYVLSNWDPNSFPLFKAAFPEIFMHNNKETFDGIMISGNVGLVKPNSAIFKQCLKKFGLTAQETLFIDDEPANVASAEKLGIQTVLSNPHNPKDVHDQVIQKLVS